MGNVIYYISNAKKMIGLQPLSNRLKDVRDTVSFNWLNNLSVAQL